MDHPTLFSFITVSRCNHCWGHNKNLRRGNNSLMQKISSHGKLLPILRMKRSDPQTEFGHHSLGNRYALFFIKFAVAFIIFALLGQPVKQDFPPLDDKPLRLFGGCLLFHRFHVKNPAALGANHPRKTIGTTCWLITGRLAGNFHRLDFPSSHHIVNAPVNGGDSHTGNITAGEAKYFLSIQWPPKFRQDFSDSRSLLRFTQLLESFSHF